MDVERGYVVFVHLTRGLDAVAYQQRFEAGSEPDLSPYGFHKARRPGWEIRFSSDAPEGAVLSFIRRGLNKVLGFDFVHALRHARAIAACDAVWTMRESEWLALCALRWLGLLRAVPMVGNSVWLFNRWEKLSTPRRWLYQFLARHCERLTVHSEGCLPIARQAMAGRDVRLMYFGISTDTFPVTAPRPPREGDGPIRIIAMGHDRTRDWDTFVAAFAGDPRFELTLVCRWAAADYDGRAENLTVLRTLPVHSSDLYLRFDLVVIPMVENRFSGITVLLESAAMGTPVVASCTGGCPTYFSDREVTYVPCRNPRALREAVLEASRDAFADKARRAQETFLARDYSTVGLVERYMALTREMLR